MIIPDTSEWITRLDTQVSELVEVGGSLELAERIASGAIVSPSCYVVPLSETPGQNELTNGVSQLVTADVAVITIVHNHVDTGSGGDALMRDIRAKVLGALINWKPCDCSPIERGAGERISGVVANVLIWQDTLSTDYLSRSV